MAPVDVVPQPPTSPRPPNTPPVSPAYTPPDGPGVHGSLQLGIIGRFEHAVEKLVRALEQVDARDQTEDAKLEATKHVEAEKPKIQASKLEYKMVDEVWDESTSKYKVVNSAALPQEVTDLDEYVFVVRARTEKPTSEPVSYVDIKSDGLRDVLRIILRDVHWLSLREDKITLPRKILYHYVHELEAYQTKLESDSPYDARLKHLNLLVDYIRAAYSSTTVRIASLLEHREITYDLLWALFKPNTHIYTTILDAKKPACYRYDSGKERTTNGGTPYFHVECRCLDFNGQVFGEVSTALGIRKFQGAKQVDRLEAFPLEFHRHQQKMEEYLVRCGRHFVSLMGQHHVQYRGNAFYIEDGKYVEVPVDSRVMVDVAHFRKVNPNYARPHINELARPSSSNNVYILFTDTETEEVKSNGLDVTTMREDDLMICSQTVYGWSFGNKRWLEFVVDDIKDIIWNPSSFDNLAIPAAKKKVITALAKSHMSRASDDVVDDFVEGKGQGLITLLHGPPGVGKTLTVEGLSELLERPLYAISAGELGQDAKVLEERLSTIFRLAHHWKAILLLDEADVFVQSRSFINLHNALVSVFLRTLEYYRGIMILTTNRVKDIDDAIKSRISVALHYGPLGLDTRKTIWESFLKKAAAAAKSRAEYTPADLDWLSRKEVNGRQIKNLMAAARALAVDEMVPLSRSQLEVVIDLDEEFQKDYSGAGPMANKASYL